LTGSILLIGLLVIGWQLAPKVSSISPTEEDIFGSLPLEITFSRPMNQTSVENSLIMTPLLPGEYLWSADGRQVTFNPQNTWPAGESISIQIEKSAQSVLRLPLLRKFNAELQVSPLMLIYLWPADGPSNLYLANPESGETMELTTEESGVLDYSISADRTEIYYSTAAEDGGSRIKLYDRESKDSGPVVKCEAELCTNPQISPSGNLLAYEIISRESGFSPTIQIRDLESGILIDLEQEGDYLESPLWSPNGWLAYYNRTQLAYQFWHPTSGEKLTLPNQTGDDGSWSPDGRYFICTEILFLGDTLAPRHLILFDLREKNTLDLSRGSFPEDVNPSFAPDGLTLAYSHKSLDPQLWTPGRELWILDIRSGENSQLTDSVDFHHTSFAWHPDGVLLAYVRYNQAALSEPPEIWLVNRNGDDAVRLIINGFQPEWIP
jgi:Tol biopolymer transport system component